MLEDKRGWMGLSRDSRLNRVPTNLLLKQIAALNSINFVSDIKFIVFNLLKLL